MNHSMIHLKRTAFNFFDANTNLCIGQRVLEINAGWTGCITAIEERRGVKMFRVFDSFAGFSRIANANTLAVSRD